MKAAIYARVSTNDQVIRAPLYYQCRNGILYGNKEVDYGLKFF